MRLLAGLIRNTKAFFTKQYIAPPVLISSSGDRGVGRRGGRELWRFSDQSAPPLIPRAIEPLWLGACSTITRIYPDYTADHPLASLSDGTPRFRCLFLQRAMDEEYDLNNPAVISFLVKMQEGHQARLEAQQEDGRLYGGRGSERKSDDGDGGSTEREKGQPDEGGGNQVCALALFRLVVTAPVCSRPSPPSGGHTVHCGFPVR